MQRSALGWMVSGCLAVLLAPPAPGSATPACCGDCNGDGAVSVAELVLAVRIALGEAPLGQCPAADGSGNGAVEVADLIRAVRHALDGCPAGECSAQDSGACGAGEFCDLPAGMCGGTDVTGNCMPRPTACPEFFAPVCGCDGQTYTNDCFRLAAGVALDREGACP